MSRDIPNTEVEGDSLKEKFSNQNNNHDTRRGPRRNDRQHFSDNRMFTEETQEIDTVIGLTSERLDKGVVFEVFQEHIENYVPKNFKKADVITLIVDLKDLKQGFEKKYAPETLSDTDEESPPKVRM